MSRSNYDKPFYVDVGTSIVAIRCASNHDVVCRRDHGIHPTSIKLMRDACDRMNLEFELYAKSKVESTQPTCDWSVKDALNFANTLANHGCTRDANADAASSCIYALCRQLKDGGNAASQRVASKMHALQRELWNGKKMGEFAFALALDGFASALSPTAPAKGGAK